MRTAEGVRCGCGEPDCSAIGKHPRASNWQHTQPYDDDQLAILEDHSGEWFGNQLLDNHGIVVASSGLLVVDVDGRNGGFESAAQLAHIREQARYIVRTGSDRKSTRLNSSHVRISYAVFCLKKKKK